MSSSYENHLGHILSYAEDLYDKVVKRWGNTHFARSTLYDWVWSDEFTELVRDLDERQKGTARIYVLHHFRVKPWPWHRSDVSVDEY